MDYSSQFIPDWEYKILKLHEVGTELTMKKNCIVEHEVELLWIELKFKLKEVELKFHKIPVDNFQNRQMFFIDN